MGGCGAILAASYCENIQRTLAFGPQYSIAPPFIMFDDRYRDTGLALGNNFNFRNFGIASASKQTQIIYGTEEWRDDVHEGLYRVHGFDVTKVKGIGHHVAGGLKWSDKNMLSVLVEQFCDFSSDFDYKHVNKVLLGYTADPRSFYLGKNFDELQLWPPKSVDLP